MQHQHPPALAAAHHGARVLVRHGHAPGRQHDRLAIRLHRQRTQRGHRGALALGDAQGMPHAHLVLAHLERALEADDLNKAVPDVRRLEPFDGTLCAPGVGAGRVAGDVKEADRLHVFALQHVGEVHPVALRRGAVTGRAEGVTCESIDPVPNN